MHPAHAAARGAMAQSVLSGTVCGDDRWGHGLLGMVGRVSWAMSLGRSRRVRRSDPHSRSMFENSLCLFAVATAIGRTTHLSLNIWKQHREIVFEPEMSSDIPIASPRDQRPADCTAPTSAMHSTIVVDMGTGVSCWSTRDSLSTAVPPCNHACVPLCTVSPRTPPPLLPVRTQFVKAGFAGEACPRACFPNVVGRPVGKRRGGSSAPPVSEVRP